jgi:hypothetical protein
MPRSQRLELAGAVYYLSNRGVDEQPIFDTPADAESFLDLLGKTAADNDWRCLGYCLLANHYHLVVRTDRPTLSRGMQALGAGYTEAVARRRGAQRRLFAARYKSVLIEPEQYLAPLLRYVLLSPAAARLTVDPTTWRWSSFRATAGLVETPAFLDLGWLAEAYGTPLALAQATWRRELLGAPSDPSLFTAWNRVLGRASILGSPEFAARLGRALKKFSAETLARIRSQAP